MLQCWEIIKTKMTVDRIIEKKTWTRKRILTITGIVTLIGLLCASWLLTSGKSKLNVDPERITISEVKKGTFQEFIPVNGVVLPVTTIYLDAIEGGQVEQKFIEDGAFVKKGQAILKPGDSRIPGFDANAEYKEQCCTKYHSAIESKSGSR